MNREYIITILLFVVVVACSYMNREYIKTKRTSEADMNYGGVVFPELDQLLEIGEVLYYPLI